MKWASENGASVEGFEMVDFKEEGFGLRATREIKVSLFTHCRSGGLSTSGLWCHVEGTGRGGRSLGLVLSLRAGGQRAANAPSPASAAPPNWRRAPGSPFQLVLLGSHAHKEWRGPVSSHVWASVRSPENVPHRIPRLTHREGSGCGRFAVEHVGPCGGSGMGWAGARTALSPDSSGLAVPLTETANQS